MYKAARKREFERIRKFEEEIEREQSEREFLREREERERIQAEKTAKNRRKREKKKGRKGGSDEDKIENGENAERPERKLGLKIPSLEGRAVSEMSNDDDDGEEMEAESGLVVIDEPF